MDCTLIWFFISQILSCELTGRVAASSTLLKSPHYSQGSLTQPWAVTAQSPRRGTEQHTCSVLWESCPPLKVWLSYTPTQTVPSCHWKGWVKGRSGLCNIPHFAQECFQSADSGNERSELWTTRATNVSGEREGLLEIFYLGQGRKTAHFNTLDTLPHVKVMVSGKKEICSKL